MSGKPNFWTDNTPLPGNPVQPGVPPVGSRITIDSIAANSRTENGIVTIEWNVSVNGTLYVFTAPELDNILTRLVNYMGRNPGSVSGVLRGNIGNYVLGAQ